MQTARYGVAWRMSPSPCLCAWPRASRPGVRSFTPVRISWAHSGPIQPTVIDHLPTSRRTNLRPRMNCGRLTAVYTSSNLEGAAPSGTRPCDDAPGRHCQATAPLPTVYTSSSLVGRSRVHRAASDPLGEPEPLGVLVERDDLAECCLGAHRPLNLFDVMVVVLSEQSRSLAEMGGAGSPG